MKPLPLILKLCCELLTSLTFNKIFLFCTTVPYNACFVLLTYKFTGLQIRRFQFPEVTYFFKCLVVEFLLIFEYTTQLILMLIVRSDNSNLHFSCHITLENVLDFFTFYYYLYNKTPRVNMLACLYPNTKYEY